MTSLRVPFDDILTFPDGTSFQRLEAISDFRQCHGVTPPERRILYRCRRISPGKEASSSKNPVNGNDPDDDSNNEGEVEEFILKIKVQIPDDPSTVAATNNQPSTNSTPTTPPPPSTPTSHELRALTIFRDSQTPSAPHLIAFSHTPQPNSANSPLPQKGYISSTVMSKINGKSLFELGYWSLADEEREEIQRGFLEAVRAVRKLGVEPGDKGLRNVMWDRETKKCGIVDFEMWDPYTDNDQKTPSPSKEAEEGASIAELRKWGLAHKPPAKNWWAEFGIVTA